jgi:hypothetical protein
LGNRDILYLAYFRGHGKQRKTELGLLRDRTESRMGCKPPRHSLFPKSLPKASKLGQICLNCDKDCQKSQPGELVLSGTRKPAHEMLLFMVVIAFLA